MSDQVKTAAQAAWDYVMSKNLVEKGEKPGHIRIDLASIDADKASSIVAGINRFVEGKTLTVPVAVFNYSVADDGSMTKTLVTSETVTFKAEFKASTLRNDKKRLPTNISYARAKREGGLQRTFQAMGVGGANNGR